MDKYEASFLLFFGVVGLDKDAELLLKNQLLSENFDNYISFHRRLLDESGRRNEGYV